LPGPGGFGQKRHLKSEMRRDGPERILVETKKNFARENCMRKKPAKPSLSIVGSTSSNPYAPPATLGKAGSKLWQRLLSEYVIDDVAGRTEDFMELKCQRCVATTPLCSPRPYGRLRTVIAQVAQRRTLTSPAQRRPTRCYNPATFFRNLFGIAAEGRP